MSTHVVGDADAPESTSNSALRVDPSASAVTLPIGMLKDILEGNKNESMKWREMVESERLEASRERKAVAQERQRLQRVTLVLRSIFFGGPFLLGFLWLLFAISQAGSWSVGPMREVIGLVQISGEINAEGQASASKVVPALERAFSNANTKAVIIKVNSPGGLPLESERINAAIAQFKVKYNKPVIAVIENVGASAAYMIAMHADEVYSGRYSLVGSVGAIMQGWDFHKAMEKLQVSQRTYASGSLKSMLNPYSEQTPEASQKAQSLVSSMGNAFVQEMKAARGDRLKPGIDYGTGEVWTGTQAFEIGLVDGIATLEEVRMKKFEGIDVHDFGPGRRSGGILSSFTDSFVSSIVTEVERRSLASIK